MHNGAITQIIYDETKRILLTASKDKKIIYWKIPYKWGNDEIAHFEKNEIKNMNDKLPVLLIQKTLAKINDNSIDFSLNEWDLGKNIFSLLSYNNRP